MLPLFCGAAERRPYQPYCVTEASSRCQSPDATYREPLRISSFAENEAADQTRNGNGEVFGLEKMFVQPAAPNQVEYLGLATTPQTGTQSQKRHASLNSPSQSGDTLLGDTNHITQAVTPRGSHSLASSSRTMCNDTPSHPRMQQSVSLYMATSRRGVRKSFPWHNSYAQTDHHPLPSVPEEATLTSKGNEKRSGVHNKEVHLDNSTEALLQTNPSTWCESGDISKPQFLSYEHNDDDTQTSSILALHSHGHKETTRYDGSVNSSEHLGVTTPLGDASIRESSHSPRPSQIVTDNEQLPSLSRPYHSREPLTANTEDQKAPRRTQPRDTNLRYQFGQPPSRPTDLPQSNSPHLSSPKNPEQSHPLRSSPRKPLSSCTDTQNGPRPPPWGCYDSLEMQRQQRNEARQRMQLCTYRKQKDNAISSLSGASHSSESFGKDMVRREVDEYRRQVLSVYPELELDGTVGFDRRRCCCVLM